MLILFILSFCIFVCCSPIALADTNHLNGKSKLPENLIVGYASWNECDDKIITAVEDGVNVLMWFAINLLSNETSGEPLITGGPNRTCVQQMKAYFIENKLPTIHMISIGGWNAPHPNTTMSTKAVYDNWVIWNDGLFDGFDWDVEGNDDTSSSNNNITLEVLDLMGEMSQMGKLDGYIVSMAPAESYMDPTTDQFDTSLLHNYPEWVELQPDFYYHGHNSYAYLLYKYGYILQPLTSEESMNIFGTPNPEKPVESVSVNGSQVSLVPTFDFISIQLYEGYSHILYNITERSQSSVEYLVDYVRSVQQGWVVDFNSTNTVNMLLNVKHHYNENNLIYIPRTQLVIGLANGWGDNEKFLLVWPDVIEMVHEMLIVSCQQPRGYMFWDIGDEGMNATTVDNVTKPMWMARGLNKFLHTRN